MPPSHADRNDTQIRPLFEFVGAGDGIGAFNENTQLEGSIGGLGLLASLWHARDDPGIEPCSIEEELAHACAVGSVGIVEGVGEGAGLGISGRRVDGFGKNGREALGDIALFERRKRDGGGLVSASTIFERGVHVSAVLGKVGKVKVGIKEVHHRLFSFLSSEELWAILEPLTRRNSVGFWDVYDPV